MIYYVSSNGVHKSGSSENTPMSLENLASIKLQDNDVVLFKRGDTFYNPIRYDKDPESRVLFSSYGTSSDYPVFSMVRIVEDETSWTCDGDNIWKIDFNDTSKYSGTKTTDDEPNNIGYIFDKLNGIIYPNKKSSKILLTQDFDFFNDDSYLYVYCSTNPNFACSTLYFSVKNIVMPVMSNIIIENLKFQHGGSHALYGFNSPENVIIRNNCIDYMGGARLTAWTNGFMRYGNAVEFFGYGKNITIENNKISNVYDTAFTLQGNDGKWNDITIRNNLLENNSQSFEIWSDVIGNEHCYMRNIYFTNNICINEGRGWGYCRDDKIKSCEIEMQFMKIDDFYVTIENNIFFNSRRLYYLDPSYKDKFINNVISNNNKVYLSKDSFFINSESYDNKKIANFRTEYSKDYTSQFTDLVSNSPRLNDITLDTEYFKSLYEKLLIDKRNLFLYEPKYEFKTIKNHSALGFVPIISIYTNAKDDAVFIKCKITEVLKNGFQMGNLYVKVIQYNHLYQYPEVWFSFENIKGNALRKENFYYSIYLFQNYSMVNIYFRFTESNCNVKGTEILRHTVGTSEIQYINEYNIIDMPGGAVCFTEVKS